MSGEVRIYVLSKGELKRRYHPPEWSDPEGHTSFAPHHRRLLEDNPFSRSDDDPVRAYALAGDDVAGHVGLMMSEVRVRGEVIPVLWGFNLLVSTRFRGRGVAKRLLECWQNYHHTAIGMHVNLASVGIYRKLGWTEFHTPTYRIVHRTRPFIEGYLHSALLGATLGPLTDAFVGLKRRAGMLGKRPGVHELKAEPMSSVSAELDELLDRQVAPVVTRRSAAWLNWALAVGRADERPCSYSLCQVRDKHGSVVGYFMLQVKRTTLRERFKDVRLALMREWGVLDDTAADYLSVALAAEDFAVRNGAQAFLATVPDERDGSVLKRLGFRPGEPLRTVFHSVPPSPLADSEFHDPRVWRFTAAEADGLII